MARGERFVMDLLEGSPDPIVSLRGGLTVSLANVILDIIFCNRPDFFGTAVSAEREFSLDSGGPSARKASNSFVLDENPRCRSCCLGDVKGFNSPIPSSSESAKASSNISDSRLCATVRVRGGREALRSSSCGGTFLLGIEPEAAYSSARVKVESGSVRLFKSMLGTVAEGSVVVEDVRTRVKDEEL